VAAVAPALGHTVIDRGQADLRNLSRPMAVYELQTSVIGVDAPICPVCRMRVVPGEATHRDNEGRELIFCSDECAERFAEAPELYTATA
jgi:YHS domain-containing protein